MGVGVGGWVRARVGWVWVGEGEEKTLKLTLTQLEFVNSCIGMYLCTCIAVSTYIPLKKLEFVSSCTVKLCDGRGQYKLYP